MFVFVVAFVFMFVFVFVFVEIVYFVPVRWLEGCSGPRSLSPTSTSPCGQPPAITAAFKNQKHPEFKELKKIRMVYLYIFYKSNYCTHLCVVGGNNCVGS